MKTYTPDELKTILAEHRKWRNGVPEGRRADLSGANLRYADLSGANLRYAYLRGANLRDAYLRDADLRDAYLRDANLRDADLRGANLRYAYLRDANLRDADLRDADLRGANLHGTCLDEELLKSQRRFCKASSPIGRNGGRIVYRTAESAQIGNTQYRPGNTYIAPHLSFDSITACHPGIYAGTLRWMLGNYGGYQLVKCYVRDGEWVISAKGAIRCKRLRVLEYVEDTNNE